MKTQFVVGVFLCAAMISGILAQDDKPTTFPPPTPPPTTNTPPTETTTSAATTSKPAPTTTPTLKPKPYPNNEGRWSVEDKDTNVTCILLKGAIEVTVSDKTTNQTTNVDVPMTATPSGNCSLDQHEITLKWNTVSGNQSLVNILTFAFEANQTNTTVGLAVGITKGKFALQNVTGTVYIADAPITISMLNKATFQTSLNHSYSCLAQETLKNDNGESVILKLEDIRVEAFRKTAAGHKEFSSAIDCPADDASDIVPIAVGGALAGLVVVVLIAYLIGRRRSRARGYQSV